MADDTFRSPEAGGRHQRPRLHEGKFVPIEEIGMVVDSLLRALGAPQHEAFDLRVFAELEALVRFIHRAKEEIGAIRPEDISQRDIPLAGDELDAIGSYLEEATGTILDACETVEAAAGHLDGEPRERLNEAVTRIYEACNFQDLTGQRITKIVSTLGVIERRIDHILRAFGRDPGQIPPAVGEPDGDKRSGDTRLLNGPQTPALANSQADIDALLASLD